MVKVKRTGPTNPQLKQLIEKLKKSKAAIWRDVAEKLSKPTRKRVEVNLSRINRHTRDGETVVVPGVVLAAGELNKKVTVAAWRFSKKAREKINAVGKAISIEELIKINPKGSKVRIMV